MSQRSTAQHCHINTPLCTIRKSHVTWNFAVPVLHSEEIRRCILLFLCTLGCMYLFSSHQDDPEMFAMMEKTRMYIIRSQDPEVSNENRFLAMSNVPLTFRINSCTFYASTVKARPDKLQLLLLWLLLLPLFLLSMLLFSFFFTQNHNLHHIVWIWS